LTNDIPSQTLLDLFTRNDGHIIDPSALHGFILVPEPAALALFGLLGVVLRRNSGASIRGRSGFQWKKYVGRL
jgi:hypothetical protein